MTPRSDAAIDRNAQKRVARKYKALGYRVEENPGPDLLPDFMRGVTPDIVARSDSDNVVIEVKRHVALKGSNDLVGIAERLSDHPDWRFELVVMDDADSRGRTSDADDAMMLMRVEAATRHQLFDLAFVYLANVLVRLAVDLAKGNGIQVAGRTDRDLLLELGFKGAVPGVMLEDCLSALAVRNNLAHAPGVTGIPSMDDVQNLLRLCEGLRQLL